MRRSASNGRGHEALAAVRDAVRRGRLGVRGRLHAVWILAHARRPVGDRRTRGTGCDPTPTRASSPGRPRRGGPERPGAHATSPGCRTGRRRDWPRSWLPSPTGETRASCSEVDDRGRQAALAGSTGLAAQDARTARSRPAARGHAGPAAFGELACRPQRSSTSRTASRCDRSGAPGDRRSVPIPRGGWADPAPGHRTKSRPPSPVCRCAGAGLQEAGHLGLLGLPAGPPSGEHGRLGTDRGDRRGARSSARSIPTARSGWPCSRRMQREKVPTRLSTLDRWLRDRIPAGRRGRDPRVGAGPRRRKRASSWPEMIADRSHTTANRLKALALWSGGSDGAVEPATRLSWPAHSRTVRCSPRRFAASVQAIHARATSLLVRKLGSPDPDVRTAAIEAAAALHMTSRGGAVRELLEDGDRGVRRAAAAAVGHWV